MMTAAGTTRALEGLRVLDLSRVLAGPWATQLLADLGADVVKVERPGVGDDTRSWGPPYFEGEGGVREAAYFVSANRGKRSIAIDIAAPEGQRVIADLAARADVLVENFKVGDLKRYGLDYATLSAANPRLIYCSISGFGQEGPYAHLPGYDFIMQAMGGLMSVTGEPEGEPMKAGVAITDIMTGLYASNGILAALQQRERTGAGQYIDIALLDVQIATMANQALNYLASGRNPTRHGNAHPNVVPYQTFHTADGGIAVATGNDRQFVTLCRILGLEDIGADPAYASNAGRVAGRAKLIPALQARFETQPTAYWLDRLLASGVPAGPVNTLHDVFADPHVAARGVRIAMPHSAIDGLPGVACPLRLSASPPRADRGPPMLGEHDGEIAGIWA
jgi:crotonobetainyl-CoA:carnitine CoA-transferase CaiB-like acyl-CoA transferase